MKNIINDPSYKKGLEYATGIISGANTFLDFSDAMLDYMGEDFPYCKSLYADLSGRTELQTTFQPHSVWENYSDEYIVTHYKWFKNEQERRNRQQEFEDNIDELQFVVHKYRNSAEFQKMLDFVGKCSCFAPFNAMLIEMQKPGATFVYSVRKWNQYNRWPKVNAQPLITLIPFGPIQCLFDYSDTEQIPGTQEIPEAKIMDDWDQTLLKTQGELPTGTLENLISNLPVYGISYDDSFSAANTYGGYIMPDYKHKLHIQIDKTVNIEYSSPFYISINRNQSDIATFHTLCHELGHLFCRHLSYDMHKRRELTIKEREFEAETVAWLVCKRHGVTNPSEEYLAMYAPDGMIPICSTEYIMKAVSEIEKMIKGEVKFDNALWYKEDKGWKESSSYFKKKRKENILHIHGTLFD